MQVATLFRETATLLGASMEAPDSSTMKLGSYTPEGGSMKQEQQDDGYETSSAGELDMRASQSHMGPMLGVARMNFSGPLLPIMKYDTSPPPPSHDPYSFVEDDSLHHHHHHHTHTHPHHSHPHPHHTQPSHHQHIMPPISHSHTSHLHSHSLSNLPVHIPKKRGRKKKIKIEDLSLQLSSQGLPYQGSMDCLPNSMRAPNQKVKERKKHDRFNGMSEDEVSKRTLPDHLAQNLDIVIIGINPGLFAAYKGHHYAGPGNHFWKCLYLSGLTPEPMTADDDYKLLKVGIGFTNMVERATKGSADLTRKEIKEGSQILLEKLRKFRPKIAVFNGKLIFEVFSGKKDFSFGRQPELVDGTNTYMWVMPSSSARCAQLPRAADKVPFYAALKKFRDYLNGKVSEIDDKEFTFSHSKLKSFCEPELKEETPDETKYDRLGSDLTDLTQSSRREDDPLMPKKKRGRPKKVKMEGEMKLEDMKPKIIDEKTGFPKKKRGRPKKVKLDSGEIMGQTECHSDPSNHCFSPPIQSPMMQSYSIYQQPQFNQNSTSPLPSSYHQSPIPSHTYTQSPQQHSFTHSDLSSEISAAISSENNPESPAVGPPDFDAPTNTNEDGSKSPNQKDDECHFSSPRSKKSFQNYDDFSTDSDSVRYPPKPVNQDVASKSLSGLESLVDQIPNIAEGENQQAVVNTDSQHMSNQYSEDSSYISEYPRPSPYSPQYNTTTSNSSYVQHSNFSVTSLANSSATDSSFSVTSLASNFTPSSYPNIMPSPMSASMVDSSSSLFSNTLDRPCRVDSSNLSPNSSIPYPYSQYSNPYSNSGTGFYPPSHNIHMPSPNFPYPSPYSNSTYPHPPSYLSNHVFDRIKHDRMDIGFGGF